VRLVLIDVGDIVVHVFGRGAQFYNLGRCGQPSGRPIRGRHDDH
jgi:hypothetical protein